MTIDFDSKEKQMKNKRGKIGKIQLNFYYLVFQCRLVLEIFGASLICRQLNFSLLFFCINLL